jgi:hypothetical protein
MGDYWCHQCDYTFRDRLAYDEHNSARHPIERRLRRKKAVPAFADQGPTQAEIDETLASIARALGESDGV